jgi:hypothetical protein
MAMVIAAPAENLAPMKQSVEVFEGILSTILQQSFSQPFAVLEKPKGAYLSGFGAVFTFEVDLAAEMRPNLFNQSRNAPEEVRKAFNEKLPHLKEAMQKALAEHADSLTALVPTDQIAVIAHLFDPGFSSSAPPLRTVIIRTTRKNVLEYKAGRITLEELKKHIEVVQY